jgi:hypothetical protein
VLTPEEFQKLSVLAGALIPHDEALLNLWPCVGLNGHLFLSAQGSDPRIQEPGPPGQTEIVRLMTGQEVRAYGFGSGVRVPLRVTTVAGGVLTLMARRQNAYGDGALAAAKTIADFLSAVLSHHHSVSRMSDDLINTLADVLDVREVFPRISEIVSTALPHDRLALTFHDDEGHFLFHAATSDDAVPVAQLRLKVSDLTQATAAGFKLIGDLAIEYLPVVEPADFQAQMLAAGYRSVLAAHTSTRHHSLAVHFWSKQPYAFNLRDLPLARRVADCIGLALSHHCAALPEQLLESELFGYERGAFTSAQLSKAGQIELAAGGVLFLDEVTEMTPSAQAKLLRVLQEREFRRLGGTKIHKVDVRVVAATNRNLKQAVERGDFRQDLYYRLSVFDISLPPLRSRSDDILLFAEAFLNEFGKSFGRPPVRLTRRAKDALLAHHWPGNVRELRNVLERGVIISEGALIDVNHLSLDTSAAPTNPNATPTDLNVVERQTIQRAVRECKGNKSRAARRLGLTRTQLYVRLRKYGIEKDAVVEQVA